MKRLLVLCFFISTQVFSICLTDDVAQNLNFCEPVNTKRSDRWCERNFGKEYKAYYTTEECSLDVQSKYIGGWFEEITVQSFVKTESRWTDDYDKKVTFTCSGDQEYICNGICNNPSSCVVKEGICKNCVGTSIKIVNFFKNIGISILATEEVSGYEVVELILSNNFVSFSSKSIYNLLTKYNSKGIRRQFKGLCTDGTEYPVVLARVFEKTRAIDSFDYVMCDTGVKKLETKFLLD